MELARSTSRGGFSVRGIFTFVLTVFVTALLWTTLVSPLTHAADEPKANWQGDSILYNGHQYYKVDDAKAGDSHGLTVGAHLYVYVEQTNVRPMQQKAHVIYFAPGSDPPTLKNANYVTYDYSSTRVYSNPQGKKTIEITPLGDESSYSACTVEGVGWIVCPISVFMADSMDWLFNDVISGFMNTQPPKTGDTHADLYVAWNIMRSVANVAFIIVFLIIIYSQLTSLGVSNYGLKKLIPRLIIAAVLVNISYYICAIAVDISNILGYSLQDVMKGIRDSTFNIDNDTWTADTTDWRAVLTFVLSGGTAGFVGFAIATAGSATSTIFLILPILLGLLLTALFVLLVLAARQAIIIILIVIAPIAFVAYLLPNTEKWFDKWRELFMTMLVFFPAFSLVYGGSQLAGGIIIQNATNIVTIVFGLAVQVAPLVITPLLLKLSGGLLGRIAGIVNDPRRGLVDRAKNWSNDRRDMYRQRSLRRGFRGNLVASTARRLDTGNRVVKERTALYTAERDNRYNRTGRHRKIYEQTHGAESQKKLIEAQLESNLKRKIRNTPHLLQEEAQLRYANDLRTDADEQLNDIYKGLQAGRDLSPTRQFPAGARRVRNLNARIAATAISVQTSGRIQQAYLSKRLLLNDTQINGMPFRDWAGRADETYGATSALTYATTLKREAEGKLVNERVQLMDHFKFTGSQRQQLARGENVNVIDDDGNAYTFDWTDPYTYDAVVKGNLDTGSIDERIQIVALSGTRGRGSRDTIRDGIVRNGLSGKAYFMSGLFVDAVGKGLIAGTNNANQPVVRDSNGATVPVHNFTYWAARTVLDGKTSNETLATNEANGLKFLRAVNISGSEAYAKGYITLDEVSKYDNSVRVMRENVAKIMDPKGDLFDKTVPGARPIFQDILDNRHYPEDDAAGTINYGG